MSQTMSQTMSQAMIQSEKQGQQTPRRRSKQANFRLARFLVVLSLATVFGAGFAMQAGAGSKSVLSESRAQDFVTITIAPGESLWSVAKTISGNDPRQLVDQIITVNGLAGADVPAGTQIRVPLN